METRKVFISYSSVDRREAFQLLEILRESGGEPWMDFFDIKPAASLDRELTANLDAATTACILLSPTSASSKWVAYEIRHAMERLDAGLRIVPILLRPCRIPEELDDMVAIDASAGLDDEAVRLRVVRAVFGSEQVDDGVLLTAGQRSAWARREIEADVERRAPQLGDLADRVREVPIREISIEVDHHTFPREPGLVVELQLKLNPLWTTPMRWFFARYREGATWPAGMGFEEPSYEEFYLGKRPPIDGKYRWYDRTQEPRASIDGTDDHSMLASFSMTFEGDQWHPASSGPVLPQTFEIPSLRRLVDDSCQFILLTHVNGVSQECDDPETSEVDLTVRAYYGHEQPSWLTLYSSKHRPEMRTVLASPAMASISNGIEREALSSLYLPPEQVSSAGYDQLVQAVLDEQPVPAADTRLAAQLAVSRAGLYAFRNNYRDAVRLNFGAAQLLEPIVMNGYPTEDDGVLLIKACLQLLDCYVKNELWAEALEVCDAVVRVPERMSQLYPEDSVYRRAVAFGLSRWAEVRLANDQQETGAQSLTESVEAWLLLAREQPSARRLSDARRAYGSALTVATRWGAETCLPLERWKETLDPGGKIAGVIERKHQREKTGPLWTIPSAIEDWPTSVYESPALRYQIPVPATWSADPAVNATSRELVHVFAGSSPGTLLAVRFMDKADRGGDMRLWVDTTKYLTGFPIMELAGDEQPKLLEWSYEGKFASVAERFSVDEAHCWTGLAQRDSGETSLRRLYMAALRRDTFAWLVSLVIETALLPGSPESAVSSSDHVRGGAVYGHIRLG
jgi:hypothetical protein